MTDLIQRLNAAVPSVRAWIDATLAEHTPCSTPVAELDLARLSHCFPETVLQGTRAVTVNRIPFPPVSEYGLPELAGVRQMAVSGITFDNLCFVHAALNSESVYFHEVVHAVQWKELGVAGFLLTYAVGLLQYGYARSPLEVMAFDLQSQFDRGVELPDAAHAIRVHASQAGTAAAEFFRQHGGVMGG